MNPASLAILRWLGPALRVARGSLAAGFLLSWTALAAENRVVILNSDLSVENYLVAQTAFKAALGPGTVEVDLGRNWINEAEVERTIRSQNPEVLYCIGSKAYLLAARIARDRRIILSSAINWQRFPDRRNTHVIASEVSPAAQLAMFRYFFPSLRRVGVLYSRAFNKEWLEAARTAAREIDIDVVAEVLTRPRDLDAALAQLLPKVDALWLVSDPVALASQESVQSIFAACDARKLPVFAYSTAYAPLGATLIISPDIPTIGRQAAGIVEEAARDPRLPPGVLEPAGSEVTLNLGRLRRYDLRFNEDALDSVNNLLK